MTRADKRRARFGARYRWPALTYLPVGFNMRRFANAVREASPVIRSISASLRQVADNMRRAREMEETARQVEAVINRPREWRPLDIARLYHIPVEHVSGPPTRTPAEFVQYADDVLDAVGFDPMYPEPHEHTDEPWPYRGF